MPAKRDYLDCIGITYGYLTVLSIIKRDGGKVLVKCKCVCGNETIKPINALITGNTKSCGCYRSKLVSNKNTRHGLRCCEIYPIWKSIRQRCYNENCKDYKYYGAVGIKLSEYWLDFKNFYDDMYDSYLSHCDEFGRNNTSLDRIDPDGNYCKENCRWSTWEEQNKTSHKRSFKTIPR